MIQWFASTTAALPVTMAAIALLMLATSTWLSWPWLVGIVGENLVRRKLNGFKRKGALVLHDVILPDRQGSTVRVDHLIISAFGIMAIETLSYPGQVFGSMRDAMWVHEKGRSRHRFVNPLRQNAAVVGILQGMIGSKFQVRHAIVFTSGKLMGSMPSNVVTVAGLQDYICEQGKILSDEKMRWITNILQNMAIEDKRSRAAHVREFMAKQGLESHLIWAKSLMAGSMGTILLATLVVGLHLAAQADML